MEENKNYYMNEEIGDSGVASTRNPYYQSGKNTGLKALDDILSRGFKAKREQLRLVPNYISDITSEKPSKYDTEIPGIYGSIMSGEDINDLRRQQQTALDRWTNALVNNITIAGTSILDTAGLLYGLIDGAVNWDANRIVAENPMLQATQDIRSDVAEAMPIYRGQKYEDKSLLGKMGTQIFWAELFQNLGYVEGAAMTGGGIGTLMKSTPKWARYIIPNLIASSSEAAVEAQGRREEYIDANKQKATDAYLDAFSKAGSIEEIEMLQDTYGRALDNIEEDATKQANFTFLSNLALLSVANQINMGRLFSRGFGSGVKLKGAAKRLDDGVYGMLSKGEVLTRKALTEIGEMSAEGLQEVGQEIIPKVAENYLDYNTFNESEFNSEKRELVTNLWESAGKAITETFNDPHTAEAFAMGFLTKAIGVPTVGRRGPTLYGNLASELYQTNREYNKQSKLVNDINTRLSQDNVLSSLYSGLVRHATIGDSMDIALNENNHYDYEIASSAQVVSDIMMFDDIGDIKGLKNMIKSVEFTDEFVNSVIKETTKTGQDGELEGPFVKDKKEMDTEEARQLMQEKQDKILKKIDQYSKIKDRIERSYPGINNTALRNATYVSVQLQDHLSRFNDLNTTISDTFDTILSNIKGQVSEDVYGVISNAKSNFIKSLGDAEMMEELNKALTIASHYSPNEVLELTNAVKDLEKISKNTEILSQSLQEIYNNPKKSEDKKKQRENIAKEQDDIAENTTEIEELSNKPVNDLAKHLIDPEVQLDRIKELAQKNTDLFKAIEEAEKYNQSLSLVGKEMEKRGMPQEDIDSTLDFIQNNLERIDTKTLADNPTGNNQIDTILNDIFNVVEENSLGAIPKEFENILTEETITRDDISVPKSSNINPKIQTENENITPEEKDEIEALSGNKEDNKGYTLIDGPIEQSDLETEQSGFINEWKPSIVEYWDIKGRNIKNEDRGIPKGKYEHAKTIHEYLTKKGSFDIIRSLKEGDQIIFTTDQSLNDEVGKIVILMATRDQAGNLQIVGSMPVLGLDETSSEQYTEYKDFYIDFAEKFKEHIKENTSPYIYENSTTIKDIYYGRSVKGTQKTALELFGIQRSSNNTKDTKDIKLGRYDRTSKKYMVDRRSRSDNPTKLERNLIIPHVEKPSKFVLLIPTVENNYYSVPIAIPLFNNANKEIFSGSFLENSVIGMIKTLKENLGITVGDIAIYSTPIQSAILEFKTDFSDIFNTYSKETGKHLNVQIKNGIVTMSFTSLDGEFKNITFNVGDSIDSILSTLYDANLILEVKFSEINTPKFKQIALTNVETPHTVNDRFTIFPIKLGKQEDSKNAKISTKEIPFGTSDSNKESLPKIEAMNLTWENLGIDSTASQNKEIINSLTSEQVSKLLSLNKVKTKLIWKTLKGTKKSDLKKVASSLLSGDTKYSKIKYSNLPKINLKEEISWLKRVLPQFADEERLHIVNNLIRIANSDNPEFAWGQFKQGIITIYNKAIQGTLFHEAFHAVTNMVLTNKELKTLFNSARSKYGNLSYEELEEKLANDFARYITISEIPIIGNIVNLFGKIKNTVNTIIGKDIYIESLFYKINNGKYSNSELQLTNTIKNKKVGLIVEITELKKKAIKAPKKDIISIFNAGYPTGGDALSAIKSIGYNPKNFKIVEWKGNHYIQSNVYDLNTVVIDKKSGIYKVDSNNLINIDYLNSLQEKYYDMTIEDEISEELLYSQEVYYRKLDKYYTNKYNYDSLSEENKKLLAFKNISVEQYNKLPISVKENILYCR